MARLGALIAGLWLWGCAGTVEMGNRFSGTCEEGHARCLTDRCTDLVDGRDCRLSCDFEARLCERGQRTGVASGRRLGSDQALLIDLMGPDIATSSAITLTKAGEIRPWKDARALMPGAFVKAEIKLPADVRLAELQLLHGPGGSGVGCFVTMSVNDKPVLGRYAPPRTKDGGLTRETWDLTRFITVGGGPQTVTLFIFNNNTAGSTAPYLLGAVEVYYRAMEGKPVTPTE